VSLLDVTTPTFDVLAEVGVVQLPHTGREIRVRIVDASDGIGPRIDVREFMTPAYWDRLNEARGRAALSGRRLRGPAQSEQYTGPLKRGWWLEPHKADELGERLLLGALRVEAITAAERDLPELRDYEPHLPMALRDGVREPTNRPSSGVDLDLADAGLHR
jgi:hypothetical protein